MKGSIAICLGDLIRAAGTLRADREATQVIAELLKIAPERLGQRAGETTFLDDRVLSLGDKWAELLNAGAGAMNDQRTVNRTATTTAEPPPIPETQELSDDDEEEEEEETDDGALQEETIPATLSRLETAAARIPPVVLTADPLPKPADAGAAPDMLPLLPAAQTRGILSRVLARRAYTGPWDLAEIVSRCAKAEMLSELPRRAQPSLSRGVQLLLDRSDAMAVFSADVEWMLEQARHVVGKSNLQVLFFAGSPLPAAGAGARAGWKPYEAACLPPPGTVVALATDFGIGGRVALEQAADAVDWLRFVGRLRDRHCPVVAFVPYGPERWPAKLVPHITIVQWDWVTTTATIHAIAGKGLAAR